MRSLDDLSALLYRANVLTGFEDYAEQAGELCIQTMLRYILIEQPHGHVEMEWETPKGQVMGGTTVSERLHHTPISEGWVSSTTPFREQTSVGTLVRFENVSEHIRFILEGTKEHPIPYGFGQVAFWWGEPHRWPPRDDLPPGPRIFQSVQHPGVTENPFVERAAEAAQPEMSDAVKYQVSNYIRDLFSDGLREVKA
jgi:hypothetical protein